MHMPPNAAAVGMYISRTFNLGPILPPILGKKSPAEKLGSCLLLLGKKKTPKKKFSWVFEKQGVFYKLDVFYTLKFWNKHTSNYTDFPILQFVWSSRLSHVMSLSVKIWVSLQGLFSMAYNVLNQINSLTNEFPWFSRKWHFLPTLGNFPKFLQTNFPKQRGHAFCKKLKSIWWCHNQNSLWSRFTLCNQVVIVMVIIIIDQCCNQPNQESCLLTQNPSTIFYHLFQCSCFTHKSLVTFKKRPLNRTFEDHGVISQLFSHITRRGARDLPHWSFGRSQCHWFHISM